MTKALETMITLYVILADHQFDLVCETRKSAILHSMDLHDNDYKITIVELTATHSIAWQCANMLEDADSPINRKLVMTIRDLGCYHGTHSLKSLTREELRGE